MGSDDIATFKQNLRKVLSAYAEQLFDFQFRLMEREIAAGWKAFHAQEMLFRDCLPEPLINELGRRYAVERLRFDIWRDAGEHGSNYRSALLTQWFEHPEI